MLIRMVNWLAVICAGVALIAAGAHVLQLPNKLALDGALWLAVQQSLYRGWGAYLGPFEVSAAVLAWVLAMSRRGSGFASTLIAAIAFSAALGLFFMFVEPVNIAVRGWTATLPLDWPAYRLRWELGHAARFVLVLIGFAALSRALFTATLARGQKTAGIAVSA